jgi:hypothetical protein
MPSLDAEVVQKMKRMFIIALLAGTPVFADIVASTTVPYSLGGTITSVDLTGLPTGDTTITTADYTVTFAGSDEADTGVVKGTDGQHAVPIVDSSGDPWTAQSGNYFSTGTGDDSITIAFNTPQTALAFLWGSVDAYNGLTITFSGGANGPQSYTGNSLSGVVPDNGFQGFGDSAYVGINPNSPGGTFTTVTFTSSQYSFEFAGVQASSQPYSTPDGGTTLALLGLAVAGLAVLRRKLSA